MQWKNSTNTYGITAMALHWFSAILVIFMLGLGIYMTDLPDGDLKWSWYGLHKSIGLLIFMLVILRIIWKRMNTTPPLPNNLKQYEIILAHASHGLLYLLLFLIPITGYIASAAGGYRISFFEWFDIPAVIAKNESVMEIAAEVHEYLAFLMIAILVLHLGAALKHHFILKDNVLTRMLPFGKK